MIVQSEQRRIALETLDNVNKARKQDANCLTSTRAGEVNPDRAYIELVRELLDLYRAT